MKLPLPAAAGLAALATVVLSACSAEEQPDNSGLQQSTITTLPSQETSTGGSSEAGSRGSLESWMTEAGVEEVEQGELSPQNESASGIFGGNQVAVDYYKSSAEAFPIGDFDPVFTIEIDGSVLDGAYSGSDLWVQVQCGDGVLSMVMQSDDTGELQAAFTSLVQEARC